MVIKREIYNAIIKAMPDAPPEIGGVIGGNNGIVSQWIMDIDSDSMGCYYSPNVTKLNLEIHIWQASGVEFMGLFHVHYWGIQTLSNGDKSYITRIMQAMPEQIKQLYFPIVVMPDRKIIPYTACRRKKSVSIYEDVLSLV